jgi:hypothetical protein
LLKEYRVFNIYNKAMNFSESLEVEAHTLK